MTRRCAKCGLEFKSVARYATHVAACRPCEVCGTHFRSSYALLRHEASCKNKRRRMRVAEAGSSTPNNDNEWRQAGGSAIFGEPSGNNNSHDGVNVMSSEYNEPATMHTNLIITDRDRAYSKDETEDPVDYDGEGEEFRQVVAENWMSIKNFHKCHKVMDVLNVRLWDPEELLYEPDAFEMLKEAWRSTGWQCKVNASVGCLLAKKTTGACRYFHSSPNEGVLLERALPVGSGDELEALVEQLSSIDLQERALRRRPNTEWRMLALTNVTFYIYKLVGVSKVGANDKDGNLPEHILRNKSVISLLSNAKTGREYDDNLCFFRCLALFVDCNCSLKCCCRIPKAKTVKRLYRMWMDHKNLTNCEFPGVDQNDLLGMEEFFDIAINVFELKRNGDSELVWNTKRSGDKRLNLNLCGAHFSYIRDIDSYCRAFRCTSCGAFFTRAGNARRHNCDVGDVTDMTFPGGVLSPPVHVFDRLTAETGIPVDASLRFNRFWATYDIEVMLPAENLPAKTDTTTYLSEHQLLSVSVCSNVPGYREAVCFVRETTADECVARFLQHLEAIAAKAEMLLLQGFKPVLQKLNEFIRNREEAERSFAKHRFSNARTHASRADMCGLEASVRRELASLTVVGFNSGKYDLNVLKAPLMRYLCEDEFSAIEHTVKKQESLTCVVTNRFRFLDITNFISPGFTYDSYLKAYETDQTKGFFPYEWMDSLEKLNEGQLPPRDAFHSKLKNKGISEEEYAVVELAWRSENMKSVKDLLVWYNNLDVAPFVEAIGKQIQVYREKGIDMLREAMSVPGIAVLWLFAEIGKRKTVREAFELTPPSEELYSRVKKAALDTLEVHRFDENTRELYLLFRENLVGGPSIVFHRHHEKDKTRIREMELGERSKPCKVILGVDANALYLFCLMQDMPVGKPRLRLAENDFAIETGRRTFGKTAQGWLAWMEFTGNMRIQSASNSGEHSIGRHNLPVDGFCAETNTVFQFHGCFWHGHNCELSADRPDLGDKTANERYQETLEKQRYIEALGYKLIVEWECQWSARVQRSPHIKCFLAAFYKTSFGDGKKRYTENEILQSILSNSLFGFVECDIEVPPEKRDYFAEMSPIFRNATLCREHLPTEMAAFAETFAYLKRPQRYLVGAMKGEKILLLTQLLRWYVDRGMVVKKIYKVIEYERRPLFRQFGESITEARRAGDADSTLKLKADTSKLIGNSAYGKMCQDKTRYRNVTYSSDVKEVSAHVRSRLFHSMNALGEETYEVTSFKKRVNMDVCVHIGFTILQYAKLRMLSFHYDFLDRYIDRSDYQAVYMDTDSNYMALSTDLLKAVKPDKLQQFLDNYELWMVAPYCPDHRVEFQAAVASGREPKLGHECCKRYTKWDSRTPGKFKEEFRGSCIVALNSKSYICSKDHDDAAAENPPLPGETAEDTRARVQRALQSGGVKLSSKGLSKRTNRLTVADYLKVLHTRNPLTGVNTGFVRKNNATYTYRQLKRGLSWFYAKRCVLSDGVSTTPLDI